MQRDGDLRNPKSPIPNPQSPIINPPPWWVWSRVQSDSLHTGEWVRVVLNVGLACALSFTLHLSKVFCLKYSVLDASPVIAAHAAETSSFAVV